MMTDIKKDRFIRWQGRSLEQLGHINNLLIGIGVATLGYQISISNAKDFIFNGWIDQFNYEISTTLILLSIVFGIATGFNRLTDYNLTTSIIKEEIKKSDKNIINEKRKRAKKTGKTTKLLFGLQTSTLAIGFIVLFIFYAERHINRHYEKDEQATNYFDDYIITLYPDSTINEVVLKKDGMLIGKAFKFNDDGTKNLEQEYVNDNQNGKQYIYLHGDLLREETYKNGKSEGWVKMYNRCGELSSEGNYRNGQYDGLWIEYHGKEVIQVDIFRSGKLIKNIYENKKYKDNIPPPRSLNGVPCYGEV